MMFYPYAMSHTLSQSLGNFIYLSTVIITDR